MILKKSLMVAGVVSAMALIAGAAGGCSSSKVLDDGGSDGGGGGDTGTGTDSGKKDTGTGGDTGSGGMCPTPADVSNFMPETLPAPVGKHLNKCTQPQLDLYHKCVVQSDMASCMQIQQQAMTTFKDCLS